MLCKVESPSRVSAMTDRRDIGLYDVPMLMSLLGLGIGMILANFQTWGILSLIAALHMFVRYCSPWGDGVGAVRVVTYGSVCDGDM